MTAPPGAPRISLIAAMSRNRVIGRENQLPWRLPEDLKRFKRLTLGHPVIMGRKTFDSIGKPLPGRLNLVVSRGSGSVSAGAGAASADADGRVWVSSLEAAVARARQTGTDEVFIIGGAQIYELALPLADRLYITWVEGEHAGDAFFPRWDDGAFREVEREAHEGYSFVTLDRTSL